MKLVKQVLLYNQEGRSDKVYEVDLCKVGEDQYVVNFRYGRRGSTLRDGTKTWAPVSLDAAQTILDKLVASKMRGGYQRSPQSATPDEADPSIIVAEVVDPADDPRRQAVLGRLADRRPIGGAMSLSRAVWRAGEMQIREAEGTLISLLGTGDQMLDYCICWALGRCGSRESIPALNSVQTKGQYPFHIRRMAMEAIRQLSPREARAKIAEAYIAQLPEPLQPLVRSGPAEAFQQALTEHLQAGDRQSYAVLEQIYMIDNEHVRPALLHVLRTAPLRPPYFLRIRRLFKAAEMRRDAEVFGVIAHRFERTRPNFTMKGNWYYRYTKEKKPTIGQDAQNAFSKQTRVYLRRRVWRTLRRLGELNDADYVRLAVGVLLPFTDDDAQTPLQSRAYDWQTRDWKSVHWDAFGWYLAFNQILYRNSPRYVADGSKSFRCRDGYQPGGREPDQREEAFPHLWQQHPVAVLHLLDDSRCELVHHFGVKVLRDCTDFCRQLDLEAVLMLLDAPYEVTVAFAFELAVARYDPSSPDRKLVAALANCVVERARKQAHQWIEDNRTFFLEDTEFACLLIASPFEDTRAFARESMRLMVYDSRKSQALIGRLFALLQSLDESGGPQAADVADTMMRVFSQQLRKVGLEAIRDLLKSPLTQLHIFAGDLILNHDTLARDPPVDIVHALLSSEDASVRGTGVRIISQLPDDTLKQSTPLLLALLRSEHADIRDQIRPTIQRLAGSDTGFGRDFAGQLLEALLVPGAPEGVPSYTARILREDLRSFLAQTSSEMVWKLLQARSGPAQEVGGLLLASCIDASTLSVAEIVKLASHDILAVREASWKICREQVERLRGDMESAVRILDANWEDSRRFAFQLFEEHFAQDELPATVLISMCDSVREDVQQFGRRMVTRRFDQAHGVEYLSKLSEHPSAALQLFATNFLQRYAADDPDRLRELTPFFVSVLSRVNKGRVSKDRVFDFLASEARKKDEAARVVAKLLTRISATCAIGDKATAIEIMLDVRKRYPFIELPIELLPLEVR